jgi:O-antigen/teichoic acid export membrane protein
MKLFQNMIVNYLGQISNITFLLISTPLFLSYFGGEKYGLFSFFAMSQLIISMFDLGLTPAFGRQIAYKRGSEDSQKYVEILTNALNQVFLIFSVIIFFFFALMSGWLVEEWIVSQDIDTSYLRHAVIIIAVIVSIRFYSGLFRSGLNGLEDQAWLNIIDIITSFAKYILPLLIFEFFDNFDFILYLYFNIVIFLTEALIIRGRFVKQANIRLSSLFSSKIDIKPILVITPFALSCAYSAILWIGISQMDKFVLSGALTLEKFGHFSIMTLIAGAIPLLSMPITKAILPRMSFFFGLQRLQDLELLYRLASRVCVAVCGTAMLSLMFFSEIILYAWTGDKFLTLWIIEFLPWYLIGNFIIAVSSLQFYLQSSFGDLKLHTLAVTFTSCLQIPLLFYFATKFGIMGVGIFLAVFRTSWFLIWSFVIHNKFLPQLHWNWLLKDVCLTLLIPFVSFITLLEVSKNFPSVDLFNRVDTIVLFSVLVCILSIVLTSFHLIKQLLKLEKEKT